MNEARDPVAAAAAMSAFAAARAAVAPDEAAMAPAAAAEAATLAADECATMSAYRYTIAKTAEAVRSAIPWSLVAPALSGASGAGRS
jgi:hypothetical protein